MNSKVIESKIIDPLVNFEHKMDKRGINEQLQEEVKRACDAALQENWQSVELVQRVEQIMNDVDIISKAERPIFENEIEQIVFDFSAEANILKNVEENTFNLALEKLGKTKVIDIVGICGYYSLISMTLNVFKVPCDTPDWPIPKITDFSNMLKIESKQN